MFQGLRVMGSYRVEGFRGLRFTGFRGLRVEGFIMV